MQLFKPRHALVAPPPEVLSLQREVKRLRLARGASVEDVFARLDAALRGSAAQPFARARVLLFVVVSEEVSHRLWSDAQLNAVLDRLQSAPGALEPLLERFAGQLLALRRFFYSKVLEGLFGLARRLLRHFPAAVNPQFLFATLLREAHYFQNALSRPSLRSVAEALASSPGLLAQVREAGRLSPLLLKLFRVWAFHAVLRSPADLGFLSALLERLCLAHWDSAKALGSELLFLVEAVPRALLEQHFPASLSRSAKTRELDFDPEPPALRAFQRGAVKRDVLEVLEFLAAQANASSLRPQLRWLFRVCKARRGERSEFFLLEVFQWLLARADARAAPGPLALHRLVAALFASLRHAAVRHMASLCLARAWASGGASWPRATLFFRLLCHWGAHRRDTLVSMLKHLLGFAKSERAKANVRRNLQRLSSERPQDFAALFGKTLREAESSSVAGFCEAFGVEQLLQPGPPGEETGAPQPSLRPERPSENVALDAQAAPGPKRDHCAFLGAPGREPSARAPELSLRPRLKRKLAQKALFGIDRRILTSADAFAFVLEAFQRQSPCADEPSCFLLAEPDEGFFRRFLGEVQTEGRSLDCRAFQALSRPRPAPREVPDLFALAFRLLLHPATPAPRVRLLARRLWPSVAASPARVFYCFSLMLAQFGRESRDPRDEARLRTLAAPFLAALAADAEFARSFLVNLRRFFAPVLFARAVDFLALFLDDLCALSRLFVLTAALFPSAEFFGFCRARSAFLAPVLLCCRLFEAGPDSGALPRALEVAAPLLAEFALDGARIRAEWTPPPAPPRPGLPLAARAAQAKLPFVHRSLSRMTRGRVLDFLVGLHRRNAAFRPKTRALLRRLLSAQGSLAAAGEAFALFSRLLPLGPAADNHVFLFEVLRSAEAACKASAPHFADGFFAFSAEKLVRACRAERVPARIEGRLGPSARLLLSSL